MWHLLLNNQQGKKLKKTRQSAQNTQNKVTFFGHFRINDSGNSQHKLQRCCLTWRQLEMQIIRGMARSK